MGPTLCAGMQAKPLGPDTALGLRHVGIREPSRGIMPRQHFLASPRSQRNAIGTGGGLEGRQGGLIGIGGRQIGEPVFFDEHSTPRQQFQDPRDDPRQHGLQLLLGRGGHGLKDRPCVGEAVDAIEEEHVQMQIEIGRRAEPLDEGDRASLRLGQPSMCDEKGGEDAMDHLQHG